MKTQSPTEWLAIAFGYGLFFPQRTVDVGGELGEHAAVYHKLCSRGVAGLIASQIICRIGNVLKGGDVFDRRIVGQAIFAVVYVVFPTDGFDHSGENTVGANAVLAPIHGKGF